MKDKICRIMQAVKEKRPLIHCITNPISITQCANTVLSAGGRPIMAEHPEEAPEITSSAQALMLNLGNITDARRESMKLSAKTAAENNVPFILDVCGAACLSSRREYALSLTELAVPSVIKGNYSEIMALYSNVHRASGVDADPTLRLEALELAAAELARKLGTVVLASGGTDIVTDGRRITHIKNGTPQLSTITGTGCMQGALCAAYLSAADAFSAAVSACAVFGICGQLAETDKGSGSFFIGLHDALSTVGASEVQKYTDLEEKEIEEV